MRGLIEKDIRLILKRKQYILLFFVLTVIMAFTMEGTFAIGYGSLLFAIFSYSTLAYDEANNGFQFLMTLPISPAEYIREKFLFCILSSMFGWAISIAAYCGAGLFNNGAVAFEPGFMTEALSVLIAASQTIAVMMTIDICFGMEKARIAMMVIGGMIAVIGIGISKLGIDISALTSAIKNLSNAQLAAIVAVEYIVVVAGSFIISKNKMEKNEY